MSQWITVYDFAGHWPKFENMLLPLAFVAIGLFIYRKAKRDANETLVMPFGLTKRQQGVWGGLVFASIAGLMSVVAIPGMLLDYAQTRSVYVHQQYKLVQGVVRDFAPMPVSGHQLERFTVKGVPFAFSDFDESDYGYNNTASHGGAIRPGLPVRIAYFDNGSKNVILKLDTLATK